MILVMAFILPNKQLYVMEMDVSKVFPLKKQKQNKSSLPKKQNHPKQNNKTNRKNDETKALQNKQRKREKWNLV